MLKNKKIMWIGIIIILIIIIITLIFFTKFNNNTSKNFKIGNNTTSQEIVDNILNMSSYKATIAVDVKSNKNESKYVLKQSYSGEEDNWQEVIEPSNIAGVKVTKSGKSLKIENANLNLSSIFENYEFISNNCLDLNSFIESYKNDAKSEWKEKDNQIIMKTSSSKKSKSQRILYISKETGNPVKMEIEDTNKNMAVYILYTEVSVNS